MKKTIYLIFILNILHSSLIAQQDSLSKTRSIKGYTLGTKYTGDNLATGYKERIAIEKISIGKFNDEELFIKLTEEDTIYNLFVYISCGNADEAMEKAKEFREMIQDYYQLVFKLQPIKSPEQIPDYYGKGNKIMSTKYIRLARKKRLKYELITEKFYITNPTIGAHWSTTWWNVSFSITDLDMENRKKQQENKKELKKKNKATNNF